MSLHADVLVRRGTFTLDVVIEAAAGEVLGVLGPNGAGKSTLLRVLAGLDPVSAGCVRLRDSVLDDPGAGVFVTAAERPVGIVFQDYRLFPHLSALDNVAFGLRAAGAGRGAARERARTVLADLGLTDLAARRPGQLSGGQAQRVALARALAVEPGLLLLDEPLAALDARTRLEVRSHLRERLRAFPGPVLVVTHDPLEAMVLADRLVVIEEGRVVQTGSPLEVARRPATQYVARLVGLNLWSGRWGSGSRVTLEGGGVVTGVAGGLPDHPSDDPLEDPLVEGDGVLVALRPTAITLSTTRPGPASARNVWSGDVVGLELLADRVRVEVDGPPHAFVDLTPAAVAELDLERGARVWLAAKATETDVYRG